MSDAEAARRLADARAVRAELQERIRRAERRRIDAEMGGEAWDAYVRMWEDDAARRRGRAPI
jgi:hypothetical protein